MTEIYRQEILEWSYISNIQVKLWVQSMVRSNIQESGQRNIRKDVERYELAKWCSLCPTKGTSYTIAIEELDFDWILRRGSHDLKTRGEFMYEERK